jgi:hypothetical protein
MSSRHGSSFPDQARRTEQPESSEQDPTMANTLDFFGTITCGQHAHATSTRKDQQKASSVLELIGPGSASRRKIAPKIMSSRHGSSFPHQVRRYPREQTVTFMVRFSDSEVHCQVQRQRGSLPRSETARFIARFRDSDVHCQVQRQRGSLPADETSHPKL